MATPTEIKLWPVVPIGALLVALGLLIGLPIAAARFDDPSRLLWLAVVPLFVAFGVLGLVVQPVRIVVSDDGIELVRLGRSRTIDARQLAQFVTPKRKYLLGEGLTVMLIDGTKVELPNDEGRVLPALRRHFPEVPFTRSDSGYLSA